MQRFLITAIDSSCDHLVGVMAHLFGMLTEIYPLKHSIELFSVLQILCKGVE
jgi:hypothetical protein